MINRRKFTQLLGITTAGVLLPTYVVNAKTYLSIEQAKQLLWQDKAMSRIPLVLTDEQVKSIQSASDIRVRNPKMQVWKVEGGGWFIVDQIIGKHENIDMALPIMLMEQ